MSGTEFDRLVDDCWGVLRGQKRILYPGTDRSAPARRVMIVPGNLMGWSWDLWDQIAHPSLNDLYYHRTPRNPGWVAPESRDVVVQVLRTNLTGSSWRHLLS